MSSFFKGRWWPLEPLCCTSLGTSWELKSKESSCERASAKSEEWENRAVYTSSTSEAGSRTLPFYAYFRAWPRFFLVIHFQSKTCVCVCVSSVLRHQDANTGSSPLSHMWNTQAAGKQMGVRRNQSLSWSSVMMTVPLYSHWWGHTSSTVSSCGRLTSRKTLRGNRASKGSRE